jgi:hypothetical protein
MRSLRLARKHYEEQSKALRQEIANADKADLNVMSAMGIDFEAAKQSLAEAAETATSAIAALVGEGNGLQGTQRERETDDEQ